MSGAAAQMLALPPGRMPALLGAGPPEHPPAMPAVRAPRAAQQAPARRSGPLAAIGRLLGAALVPVAIVPVVVLGPGLLRAPARLSRQAGAEVQRVERAIAPARAHRPVNGRAMRMSLRWSARQITLVHAVTEAEKR